MLRPRANRFWHYAPWLARFILAVPTLLFVAIGWKYLTQPWQTATASAISLGSPAAVTDMRAEGALFLAVAAFSLFALSAARRHLAGLVLIALVIGFIAAARLEGLLVDGPAAETMFKLVPETVLLVLSMVGIVIERRRLAHLAPAPRHIG